MPAPIGAEPGPRPRRRPALRPLCAAALAAVAYALAFPPFGRSELLWVALVPLIRVLDATHVRAAALAGGIFACLATALLTAWFVPTVHGYFGRSAPSTALLLAVLWLLIATPFYALAWGALAWLRPRMSRTAFLLLVPTAWAAAEFARAELLLGASWVKVGDAFASWPQLRQLADLTGVYGVSALVVLGNAVAAEALRAARGRDGASVRPLLATGLGFALLLAAALGYGTLRRHQLAERAASRAALDVLLVQGNVRPELRWRRTSASRVLHRYGGLTRRALREGPPPDLVVWPENAVQTSLEDPVYGPALRKVVELEGVPLLFGAPRSAPAGEGARHFNSAFLLSPGAPVVHYDKRRLLPFSEVDPLEGWRTRSPRGDLDAPRYAPGGRPGLFDLGDRALGLLICFEAIYPAMSRELVASGAGLLVNLTNEGWFRGYGGGEQHFQEVVYRAVEGRVPVLRATTTGITAVIAPDGEVVARLDRGQQGVLRATVRPGAGPPTFYVLCGDVFAWGCVGALGGALPIAALRARRRPGTPYL